LRNKKQYLKKNLKKLATKNSFYDRISENSNIVTGISELQHLSEIKQGNNP
jgi:hypothetical protein